MCRNRFRQHNASRPGESKENPGEEDKLYPSRRSFCGSRLVFERVQHLLSSRLSPLELSQLARWQLARWQAGMKKDMPQKRMH